MNDNASHAASETKYEKNQKFNWLVSWLHTIRYRNVINMIDSGMLQSNHRPLRVIDIGCAHSKLYFLLNERIAVDYTGIDSSPISIKAARARYGHNDNFRVIQDSALNLIDQLAGADVIFALETLEHIPERDVVRIVEAVAAARPKLFVCSVPVEIGPAVWVKTLGSWLTGYVRHRDYTWAETFWAGLYKLDRLPPHGITHRGFDWRWLAQTIRHNMAIIEFRKSPFNFIPVPFAFSVFIVATSRSP
jgi:SAM-dependent methyltransferase